MKNPPVLYRSQTQTGWAPLRGRRGIDEMDLNEGFGLLCLGFYLRYTSPALPRPPCQNPVLHSHHAEELENGALRNPILALNKLSNYLVLEPLQFHLSLDGERGMVTKHPN